MRVLAAICAVADLTDSCIFVFVVLRTLAWQHCRWVNHLSPGVRKESWSKEEEETLIEAHRCGDFGNSVKSHPS
eukprot:SAG22_NODE_793_length_7164_cov_30.556043_5_plen_74_part_00